MKGKPAKDKVHGETIDLHQHIQTKVPHVIEEGSRNHVVSYDTNGRHCNVVNCEINYP